MFSPACPRNIYNYYLQMQFELAYVSVSLRRHIILICFNREKYDAGNVAAQGIITARSLHTREKGRKGANVKMQVRAKYIISVYTGAFSNADFFVRVMKPGYYLRGVSEMFMRTSNITLVRLFCFDVRLKCPKEKSHDTPQAAKQSDPSKRSFPYNDVTREYVDRDTTPAAMFARYPGYRSVNCRLCKDQLQKHVVSKINHLSKSTSSH